MTLTDSQIPIESETASASLSLADIPPPQLREDHMLAEVPLEAAEEGEALAFSSPEPAIGTDPFTTAPPVGADTTTATMTTTTTTPKRFSRNCLFCSVLCFLTAVTLAVVVGVTVSAAKKSSRPSEESIVNYLVQQKVSSETLLRTANTPHSQAVKWLAEDDEREIFLPSVSIDDMEDKSGYMYMVRYVMVLNYFALGGKSWPTQVNFLSDDEVCLWNGNSYAFTGEAFPEAEIGGLMCDRITRLPIYLDLEYNNLRGTIPSENGLLTTLLAFDFQHNVRITSTIPTELCQLTNLQFLSLADNRLFGTIPECISKLTDLHTLHLQYNQLTGTIPSDASFCNLNNMGSFAALRNSLRGKIPGCIGEWTKLQRLVLSDNDLTGEIPADLAELTNLWALWLDGNDLRGDPTYILNSLTNLELVYMEDNQFSGVINEDFVANLDKLAVADLSHNNFTSNAHAIPSHLLQLPELQILDLSVNALDGRIPRGLEDNKKMIFLSVHENDIKGAIPSEIQRLSSMQHLDLSSNQLHGSIPEEIFQMSSLVDLVLSENPDFDQGPLPSSLANLTGLQELAMKNTNRNGTLPELLDFDELVLLDLDNNDFEGQVPENYGQLERLRYLLLNRNGKLTGDIPVFNKSRWLQVVLMDGTDVTGNYTSICERPAISGQAELSGKEAVVVDCDPAITCQCCHCCARGDDGCTDPYVDSLNHRWENMYVPVVRDFGINLTQLNSPLSG